MKSKLVSLKKKALDLAWKKAQKTVVGTIKNAKRIT